LELLYDMVEIFAMPPGCAKWYEPRGDGRSQSGYCTTHQHRGSRVTNRSGEGHSQAAATLRRIADSIGETHVDHVDRVRLRTALDELCEHRPHLKRICERVIMLAASCSVALDSGERAATMQKLKDMVHALAKECG